MNYVAKLLEMPPMRVYEVATFYTMFNRCVFSTSTPSISPYPSRIHLISPHRIPTPIFTSLP